MLKLLGGLLKYRVLRPTEVQSTQTSKGIFGILDKITHNLIEAQLLIRYIYDNY